MKLLRHGPAGGDRGPVIGFLLQWPRDAAGLYVSGDTVRFDGVDEVGRRFRVSTALLHMGAAKVAVAGPAPLTFTATLSCAARRSSFGSSAKGSAGTGGSKG